MALVEWLKRHTPWWGKFVLKLMAYWIPSGITDRLFVRLGFYKHGDMVVPTYSIRTFQHHLSRGKTPLPEGFHVLELGPGNSVSTAIVAYAHGAGSTVMVDAGSFAETSLETYRNLIHALMQQPCKRDLQPLLQAQSLEELLTMVHATYLVQGLESLRTLPADSFDFVFSNAVLEHIFLDEVDALAGELYRILRPGGFMSHTIDFEDHLGHSLNSLRFSQAFWEGKVVRNAGFYTNRMRVQDFCTLFDRLGFQRDVQEFKTWDKMPLEASRLHPQFQRRQDLLVKGADLVCTKPKFG